MSPSLKPSSPSFSGSKSYSARQQGWSMGAGGGGRGGGGRGELVQKEGVRGVDVAMWKGKTVLIISPGDLAVMGRGEEGRRRERGGREGYRERERESGREEGGRKKGGKREGKRYSLYIQKIPAVRVRMWSQWGGATGANASYKRVFLERGMSIFTRQDGPERHQRKRKAKKPTGLSRALQTSCTAKRKRRNKDVHPRSNAM